MLEEKQNKCYKIEVGDTVRVFKSVFNDRVFYKIQMQQKKYDGTKEIFYKPVNFKKGVEIENETDIVIKSAFENLRKNPNDKYNPISSLMIMDYEIVKKQEEIVADAFAEYNNTVNSNDIDLSDELPF